MQLSGSQGNAWSLETRDDPLAEFAQLSRSLEHGKYGAHGRNGSKTISQPKTVLIFIPKKAKKKKKLKKKEENNEIAST